MLVEYLAVIYTYLSVVYILCKRIVTLLEVIIERHSLFPPHILFVALIDKDNRIASIEKLLRIIT